MIPDEVWSLMWDWQVADADSARQWLRERTEAEQWDLLDLIARFASASAVLGTQNPVWKLSGLDLETIDNLIGLKKVYASLQNNLDGVHARPFRERSVEATAENRRLYVLAKLKLARDELEAE